MRQHRGRLLVPCLVILLGVTWLLNVLELIPGVDWIWTIGLGAVGILTLLLGGLNKLTVVLGPWFLIGSVCSVLRQTDRLPLNLEIPILTIALGCLLLFVQILRLPTPDFLKEDKPKPDDSGL